MRISFGTYWRTVRHLRRQQVFARLRRHLFPRFPYDVRPAPPLRTRERSFGEFIQRAGPIRQGNCFHFLTRSHEIVTGDDWNARGESKLWLYNLHYFDWLRESAAAARIDEDASWLDRWIAENPRARGVGWDPYPISLRTVNWVIWFLTSDRGTQLHFDSLAAQVRHLAQSVEYHLYGNHLLANAKAFVFAGAFFDGPEADNWRSLGLKLLEEQLGEQILPDGAHFELSPMYHSIILEDVLDLLGLGRTYPHILERSLTAIELTRIASRMMQWLSDVQHPDGQIPYFNDAAFGIAPSPAELVRYSARRGVTLKRCTDRVIVHQPSGYAVLASPPFHVIFDGGRIGPDYLPGHAHADTLSIELSVGPERIISNSGISTYERGREREWERSTAAHATVEIDGLNSAETWASFRVGRRPNVGRIESGTEGTLSWIECWHDGYSHLPGSPIHRRRVSVAAAELSVSDQVEGAGTHTIRGIFPIHPGVKVEQLTKSSFRIIPSGKQTLEVSILGPVEATLQDGAFAPAFGTTLSRPVIEWRWHGKLPLSVKTRIGMQEHSNWRSPC